MTNLTFIKVDKQEKDVLYKMSIRYYVHWKGILFLRILEQEGMYQSDKRFVIQSMMPEWKFFNGTSARLVGAMSICRAKGRELEKFLIEKHALLIADESIKEDMKKFVRKSR